MSQTETATTRQRVATGGIWMMVNSISSRIFGFVGQLVLAWLLLEEEFGLFAIANSMAMLVDLVGQFGLSDVLVNRYRRFHLWSPAGFAISVALGFIAAGVMLLLAVVGSYVYDDANLGWLVAIMAAAGPLRGLGILSYTQLRAEMRFRPIAIVQSLGTFVYMGSAILLALLGFGAYSFAWAKVADTAFRTASWIRIASYRLPRRLTFRGSKYLISDSLNGYINSICNNIITQCDYIILGLFVSKELVGSYFMAFTISAQAISLIAMNLTAVLFPAYNTLADNPQRQVATFIRSSKMLAFISAPVCVLQALVAAPLIPLILEPRWHDIVPLVQIISIGTAVRCASYSWAALLKAQRRFSTVAKFSATASAIFPFVIAYSCYQGGVRGCAIGASLFFAVLCPMQLFVTIRSVEGAFLRVLDLCLRPLAIAAVAFGLAWLLASPARSAELPIVEMAIDALVGGVLYWLLSWLLNPVPVGDLGDLWKKLREKIAPSAPRAEKSVHWQAGDTK